MTARSAIGPGNDGAPSGTSLFGFPTGPRVSIAFAILGIEAGAMIVLGSMLRNVAPSKWSVAGSVDLDLERRQLAPSSVRTLPSTGM